jgi:cobalt/nickel transport system permease protein
LPSWFASSNADGLEWSIARVVGANEELTASSSTHQAAEKTQAELAILPDYGFKPETAQEAAAPSGSDDEGAWPAVSAGTSVSGLAGAAITLLVAGALGLVLRRRSLARSRAGD